MDLGAEFKRWKAQCLGKVDLSRKGIVDEDVSEIVQLLNGREQFFTTSSCAGRIILLDGVRTLCALPVLPRSVHDGNAYTRPMQHPNPASYLSFWSVVSVSLNWRRYLNRCV